MPTAEYVINKRVILVAILFFSATISLFLSISAWRRRENAGRPATFFSLCMAAVTVYSFGYAMELSSNTLKDILFWIRIEHFGIQTIAPTWLLFALCMTGREKLLTIKRIVPLFIIPVVYIFVIINDPWRYFVYKNPGLVISGPFSIFTFEKGPIYWLSIMYISLCLATSTVLFTLMLVRSVPPFRGQAIIFFVGALIPWIGMGLYVSGNTPYKLDFTPITFSISGLINILGILQFRVLEIVPLARDFIFEGLSDGVLILDKHNQVVDFNPALQIMLPKIRKASIGLSVYEALVAYPKLIGLVEENSSGTIELQISSANGIDYYQARLSPVLDGHEKVLGKIISFHDYTKTKYLLEQLRDLATLDELTGVYNRRYFNELVSREIDRVKRYGGYLSLIILDLDHFKRVNDTYGHAAGDIVLKTVAETCRGIIRKSDIFGRLGGEEFVTYLSETNPNAAVKLAERLREAIERQQIIYEGHSISITASFGVFGVDSSVVDVNLESLFRYADKSLYEAKEKGRNRVGLYV